MGGKNRWAPGHHGAGFDADPAWRDVTAATPQLPRGTSRESVHQGVNELLKALFRTRPRQAVVERCAAIGAALVRLLGRAEPAAAAQPEPQPQVDEQGRKIYQLGGNPRVRPYWVRRVVRVVLATPRRRLLFSSGARGVLAFGRLCCLCVWLVARGVADAMAAPVVSLTTVACGVARRAVARGRPLAAEVAGAASSATPLPA